MSGQSSTSAVTVTIVAAMSTHVEAVGRLLGASSVNADALAGAFNGLDSDACVAAIERLTKRDMIRMWGAVEGRQVDAESFVPAGTAVDVEVIHEGKNSLPVFSRFQKRFTLAQGRPGVLYGYNHNWFNFTTAGPGYFVAHQDDSFGAYGLDYCQLPPRDVRLPSGWPAVVPQNRGLQRFIYANMVDYMRGVSDRVTIGRAWVKGKMTNNYFVLSRTGR